MAMLTVTLMLWGLLLQRHRQQVQGSPASSLRSCDLNPGGPDLMLPWLFSGSAILPSPPSSQQAPVQGIRFLRRKKKCPDAVFGRISVYSWPWQMKDPISFSKVRPSWVHGSLTLLFAISLCASSLPWEEGLCICDLCFRDKGKPGDLPKVTHLEKSWQTLPGLLLPLHCAFHISEPLDLVVLVGNEIPLWEGKASRWVEE